MGKYTELPYQYQVLREAAERHLDAELLEDESMLQNADHARRIADSAIARAKQESEWKRRRDA